MYNCIFPTFSQCRNKRYNKVEKKYQVSEIKIKSRCKITCSDSFMCVLIDLRCVQCLHFHKCIIYETFLILTYILNDFRLATLSN